MYYLSLFLSDHFKARLGPDSEHTTHRKCCLRSQRKKDASRQLTDGRLAGEHRGGEGAGRGSVQPGGPLDQVGRPLQEAAGHADVVNPQETAAGERKVPTPVKVEHGGT